MFHKACNLEFKEGTTLEVTFQNGEVKAYDMAALFSKYPQLEALNDRTLFLSGRLMGTYGICWNENLDVEVETIYEDGKTVGKTKLPICVEIANTLSTARAKVGISQTELSAKSGIDQSDISKLERGIGNPSVGTLNRLADALGMELCIKIQ